MSGPQDAFARSLDRTVVRVHCAEGELPKAQHQGLCRSIVQALAQIIPQSAPRMVPEDQWQPARPNDISVRLKFCGSSGKLLWQQGPTGELHTGPDLPLRPADMSHAAELETFADKLVAATRPLLARTLK